MPNRTARELFNEALALPVSERLAWLNKQPIAAAMRTRVQTLLKAEAQACSPLDQPFADQLHALGAGDEPEAATLWTGRQVGAYEVGRLLGQGGMASVFEAKRIGADFEQRVAIKVLRRTLHTELELRLFQRERQVLAALEHPNIARLLDGGITDGNVPYLVMEFVDGIDVLHYAESERLSLRARLALFAQVCDAVNAAHRALIVHRDIKPSNILVNAQGVVKLLDFGIAKMLNGDAETQPTTFAPMTPEYAAPEQMAGRAITTATDVYGLGVVLYELLIGDRPRRGDTTRASDALSAHTTLQLPTQPRTIAELRRFLRGDIDNILRQSLATDPRERYDSAGALASDLRRFLDGQPVQAHPPSGWYRTKKFVRRNLATVAVAVLFSLALMATAGIALKQAQQARAEGMRANAVRDFMVGLFESAQGRLPRDVRATPEQLVAEAERKLKADMTLDNATRAEILQSLATVSFTTAQYPAAVRTLSEASSLLAPDDPRRLRIVVLLAGALDRSGDSEKALALIEPLQQQLTQAPTETAMEGFEVLMNTYASLGDPERSIAAAREQDRIAQAAYAPDDLRALKGHFTLGNTLSFFQKTKEALLLLDQAIASWKAQGYPVEKLYLDALGSQAAGYANSGQAERGERAFAELLAAQRTVHQPPHDDLAHTMRNLGVVLARNGKTAEAIAMLTDSLAMMRTVFGDKDQQVVMSYYQLGAILLGANELDQAQTHYAAGVRICDNEKLIVVACARVHQGLGQVATRRQQWPLATSELDTAERLYRGLYDDNHIAVATILSIQAGLAVEMGRADDALRLAQHAMRIYDSNGLEKSRDRILAHTTYAKALWRSGNAAAAVTAIDQAIAAWQNVEPNELPRNTIMLSQKAQYLRTMGSAAEAKATARQAIALGTPAARLTPEAINTLREIAEDPKAWR
jgi:eukaryotic-like serine/threonine-protein kinase